VQVYCVFMCEAACLIIRLVFNSISLVMSMFVTMVMEYGKEGLGE